MCFHFARPISRNFLHTTRHVASFHKFEGEQGGPHFSEGPRAFLLGVAKLLEADAHVRILGEGGM